MIHYHQERNHQSSGNRIIRPEVAEFPTAGVIDCRERLGGMLRYTIGKLREDKPISFRTLRGTAVFTVPLGLEVNQRPSNFLK